MAVIYTDQMNQANCKILICDGGTGGHIIPGLAIAKDLQQQGVRVTWLGTKAGLEAQLVPAAGIPISYITIGGMRGKGLLTKLITPFKIFIALVQASKMLIQHRPRLVLGMGGFVTGPAGLAAWLLGIPLVIHEQNAIAGTTNRMLARLAAKVLTGFPNCFATLKHAHYTGNPVRAELLQLPPLSDRIGSRTAGKLKLLVLGGSRGALALNQTVPNALASLATSNIEVWHQAGQQHWQTTSALYQSLQVTAKVVPFIDNMPAAYGWADLIVCRAGALTIAEIAAVGIASILVPFPYAIDDHQSKNAEFLSLQAAAILVPQAEFTPLKLAQLLDELLHAPEKLNTLATNAYELANKHALAAVSAQCMLYLQPAGKGKYAGD